MRASSLAGFTFLAIWGLLPAATEVSAQAGRLCPVVESEGEGHWPLSEDAFTQDRAEMALESLTRAVNGEAVGVDFTTYENDLMYVKGYLLKSNAEVNDTDVEFLCDFIKSEAYVHH